MKIISFMALLLAGAGATTASGQDRGPVLDMHIHAYGAGGEGPPSYVCAPFPAWRPLDPGKGGEGLAGYMKGMFGDPACPRRVFAALTDDDLRDRTIAALRRNDMYAVAGGNPAYVDRWLKDEPTRLIPAVGAGSPDDLPSIEELRARFAAGRLKTLSELSFQYNGILPDDPRMNLIGRWPRSWTFPLASTWGAERRAQHILLLLITGRL